jgi:hypothetical protein
MFLGVNVTSAALLAQRNDPSTAMLHLLIHSPRYICQLVHSISPLFINGTSIVCIAASEEHDAVSSGVQVPV